MAEKKTERQMVKCRLKEQGFETGSCTVAYGAGRIRLTRPLVGRACGKGFFYNSGGYGDEKKADNGLQNIESQ